MLLTVFQMLKNYKHNDIVINFYRAIAYRFDPENVNHLKDISRCRLANFKEMERFEKLEKTQKIIYLNDLNIKKWDRENKAEIQLSDNLLRVLIDISNEIGSRDINEILHIEISKHVIETPDTKPLKNQITDLKAKLKDIKKYINSIKI